MSNFSSFSPDDPRLTAFALGELEGEELAAVEAALRDDPAARAAVDGIRATVAKLEKALAAEAVADTHAEKTPDLRRAAIIPGPDRGKLDGGPLRKIVAFPRALKFPQLYYVVGGLAAAAFAVLVAYRQEPVREPRMQKARDKTYLTALNMVAPTEAPVLSQKEQDLAILSNARQRAATVDQDQMTKAESTASTSAPAPAPVKQLQESLPADAQRENFSDKKRMTADALPAPSAGKDAEAPKMKAAETTFGATGSDGGRVAANEPALSKFTVNADKNTGYLNTNSGAVTRVGMEVQRAPLAVEVKSADILADTNAQSLHDILRDTSSGSVDNSFTATRPASSARPVEGITMRGFQVEGAAKVSPGAYHLDAAGRRIHDTGFNWKSHGGFGDNGASGLVAGKMQASAESYAYQRENDFLGAKENPLSTFSVDVDTASYANVRRIIREGRLPPVDAVRIEELVNYFPYRYAPPALTAVREEKDLTPFAATMEVAEAPWAPGHRLVRIGLKGREISTATRGAANLVFLLDVSGSMAAPNKLPLVKDSMRLLLGKLRPDDRVAIVTYAGASGLALASTPVAKSQEIIEALEALTASGGTNGGMGIQLAYDIAKANFVPGGLNRVILCTDGDFNVGVTNEGDLARLIEEKAKSGVRLTVLGFGMGNYKDATLELLAGKGNGNYGYIDSHREAEKLLVEQVNGTLVPIAKDVKLQVEFNPAQVASYRLIGYEDRLLKKEDFNDDAVNAGEVGAGHTVTALYEVVPVSQVRGDGLGGMGGPKVDALKYGGVGAHRAAGGQAGRETDNGKLTAESGISAELLTLKVRFKAPAGTESRKLEFPLTDGGARFADASADFKFVAAVAEFGMILRDSPHKGTATLANVLAWAQEGTDGDVGGYRSEFIELVRQAQALAK